MNQEHIDHHTHGLAIAQIKAAVDLGKTVHWANEGYRVTKDGIGQYLIVCDHNQNCIGLTNRAGDRLNGKPTEFFIKPD